MSIAEKFGPNAAKLWQTFITQEQLTPVQADQFEQYLTMLRDWNEQINLTRIIDVEDIIAYHFQDSMRIADYVDIGTKQGICDVGTGAGFPGIPLKILYPDVPVVLLEVNNKKAAFLEAVIAKLGLQSCEVNTLDWRTFLRQTTYTIDLFVARASLQLEQLVHVFKPSCRYNKAELIYWASQKWKPGLHEKPYLIRQQTYTVGNQQRVYAFFSAQKK